MFVEAQTSEPSMSEGRLPCVEPLILAWRPSTLFSERPVGEMDGLYEELRANQKIYQRFQDAPGHPCVVFRR
jgi:hypothetical protein